MAVKLVNQNQNNQPSVPISEQVKLINWLVDKIKSSSIFKNYDVIFNDLRTDESNVGIMLLQGANKSRQYVDGGYADMLKYYYEAEEHYGVRADIAICQSILETGWFKFTGYAKPWMNNYAGLGVTDVNANANVGIFPSPFLGIVAQMQHLLAYASVIDPTKLYSGWVIVDNRFNLVKRGCAPFVEWLGQQENPSGKGWATGANYGYKILKILNNIKDEYNKYVDDKSSQDKTDEQVDDLSKRCDVSDYEIQVNPTKIYIYAEPSVNSDIVKTIRRGKYVIIEEQNGFGLLDTKEGWLQLSLCSYVRNI